MIWNTPVPQIILALEGKYDFVIKTNPFGGGEDPLKKKVREEKLATQRTALAMARAEIQQKLRDKQCQKPQKDS